MKYIDSELLRKEIEKNKNMIDGLFTEGDDSVYDGENDAYNRVLRIIDSLQQKQPEQPVEDLNELIRKWDRVNINTIQKAKVKTTGEIIDGFYDGRGHFDHFVDHDIFDRYSVEDVEPIIDEQPSEGLEEEIQVERKKLLDVFGPMNGEQVLAIKDIARHFVEWGRKQVLQEIYEGKVKPVDKITAAWLDDE